MGDHIYYDSSSSWLAILLTTLLSLLYLLLALFSIKKLIKPISTHYKTHVILLLISIFLISIRTFHIVGIIRGILVHLSIKRAIIRAFVAFPLSLYVFIISTIMEIFLDVYESLISEFEHNKIYFVRFAKVVVAFAMINNLIFTLIIVILGDEEWMISQSCDATMIWVDTINWIICCIFLGVLTFFLRSSVSRVFMHSFGEEVNRNIKTLSLIFLLMLTVCIVLCDVCFYLYKAKSNPHLRYCLFSACLYFLYYLFLDIIPISAFLKYIYNLKSGTTDSFADLPGLLFPTMLSKPASSPYSTTSPINKPSISEF
jgi:hypothetical protein